MEDDEAVLLEAARGGDEEAFRRIYARHRGALIRYAYRMHGSLPLAEDLSQQSFLGLLERPNGFEPWRGASLRTYLLATVRNLALKRLNRSRKELLMEDVPDCISPDPTPLDGVLAAETTAMVQAAVSALPYLQREAVVLFEYEDLSLAEVAAIVDCEIGAVKARLSRARDRLRRTLEPLLKAQPRRSSDG